MVPTGVWHRRDSASVLADSNYSAHYELGGLPFRFPVPGPVVRTVVTSKLVIISASAGAAGASNSAGDALANSSTGRQTDTPLLCQKKQKDDIHNYGKDELSFIQINVQHSRAGTANLCKPIADLHNVVALVQEPWINKEKILGFGPAGATLYRGTLDVGPHTCILTKGVVSYSLPQFCDRDTTTVCLSVNVQNREKRIVITSIYLPIEEQLTFTMLDRICNFCKDEKLPLIVGCDSNAHHPLRGGSDINQRGQLLSEFLATTDLEVANLGNEPTFCVWNTQTIIDVTLVSRVLLRDGYHWHVSCDDSMSDHCMIRFAIKRDKSAPIWCRNVKHTDWQLYEHESCKNQSVYGLDRLIYLRI